MKLIVGLGIVLLFAGCLYLAIRTRFPRRRKEPTPVTPEMLKRNWWNYLIAVLGCLLLLLIGRAAMLYGLLQRTERVSDFPSRSLLQYFPGPLSSPMFETPLLLKVIIGVGVAIVVTGITWKSIAVYRIVRNLWWTFCRDKQRAWGKWLGWMAILIGEPLPLLALLFVANRRTGGKKQKLFCVLWVVIYILLWSAQIAGLIPFWSFLLPLLAWQLTTFAALTAAALRLLCGDDPIAPLPPRACRNFRRQGMILALLAVFTGGVFLAVQCHIVRLKRQAESRLTERGAVLTPEEMAVRHPAPERNIYESLRQSEVNRSNPADSLIRYFDLSGSNDFLEFSRFPPEAQAKLTDWQNEWEPTAQRLDRISPDQAFQSPREWESGYTMSISELSYIRKWAAYETMRIRLTLDAGDTEKLMRLWRQLQTLQDWARNGGSLISNLAAISIGEMQLRSAETMLNALVFPDADLSIMRKQLQEEEAAHYSAWRDAFVMEAFFISHSLQPEFLTRQPQSQQDDCDASEDSNLFFQYPWILTLNRIYCQNCLAALIDLSDVDYYRAEPELNALQEAVGGLPVYLVFPPLLSPNWTKTYKYSAMEIARLRILRTAIAAELYRRQTGHWPERLADLVPEFLDAVPVDPFDGQPLRMCRGELEAFAMELLPIEQEKPDPFLEELQSARQEFSPDEVVEVAAPELPRPADPDTPQFTPEYHPVTRNGFRVYSVGEDKIDNAGQIRPSGYREPANQFTDPPPQPPDNDISFTWYRESESGH